MEGQSDGASSNLEAVADRRSQCLAQSSDGVGCGLRIRVVAPSPVMVAPSSLCSGVKTSVIIPCKPSLPQGVGMGQTDSSPCLKEQDLQVFWSVTAIVSLCIMIFILTRE